MGKRAEAKEETRRRIVTATAKLHGENGVLGTSWQDIAREADVSVATVYSHFPTLRELLPACGALVMERARPPRAENAATIVGDAVDPEERLRRVAGELFGFYERGGSHLEVDAQERKLPGMREWEEAQRATVAEFVREAIGARSAGTRAVQLASALFDLPTFKSFRTRGLSVERAADVAAALVAGLEHGSRTPSAKTKEMP